MEEIEQLMNRLVADADRIVASPSTIEDLIKQGVPFDQPPKYTLEESLNILFDERKKAALQLAKQLPTPPNIAVPFVILLYNEIRECIIFSLHGAAITLSGILIEFVLKYATHILEMRGKFDNKQWEDFEEITLDKAINRAAKIGLLNEKEVKKLKNFKNEVRNPYNHYNVKKITKSVIVRKVKILNVYNKKITEQDIAAKDDPVIQAQVKPFVDAKKVSSVFNFADQVVKEMFIRMNQACPPLH